MITERSIRNSLRIVSHTIVLLLCGFSAMALAQIHIEAESNIKNSGMTFEATSDAGGGENAGWIDAGDYLDFSVHIPTSGTYRVDYRVASPNATGSVILGEGGSDLAPALAIPNTGGWQAWTTISNEVYLTAGTHTLVIYAATGGWNINWFELHAVDATPDAIHIEAESAITNSGITFEATSDAGGGQNAGWIDAGDYLNFNVSIPASGTYRVDYRVASPNTTGSVIVGEGGFDLAPALAVPNTGGWQSWTTISNEVYLTAGTHTLVIYAAAGGWNINWFELHYGNGTPPPTNAMKVIGYAPSWSTDANAVDYSKLTHINYSFVLPNSNGTLQPVPNPGLLQSLVSNGHANGVKVLIAIGGWNNGDDSAFESFASTSWGRDTFVNAVVALTDQYNLDGVDIDWEYPDPGASGNNYTLLMDQLASAMHSRGKLLSAAVVASGYTGGGVQNAVFNDVDYLNLMAYDGGGANHSPYSYAVDSLNYWTGRGLPAEKAVLGVPFYARPSWAAYSAKVLQNWANICRDTDGSDYWNGIPTIRAKGQLASNYGGIMTWEISQDTTGSNSLLTAMWEAVNGLPGSYNCN